MGNTALPVSSTYRGWYYDKQATGGVGTAARLHAVFNGTSVLDVDADDLALTPATTFATTVTVTTSDLRITAGNVRLGAISTFATTEPTSAIVLKSGTQAAGAITTSSGIMANDTVLRKIIAAGTVSNIET